MRVFAAFVVLNMIAIGAANASSILVLTPGSEPAPSIVTLGASAFSPSVVALGEPLPGVADEKVSAIGTETAKPKRNPTISTMVIRGGLVGDAVTSVIPASFQPQDDSPQDIGPQDNGDAPAQPE